MEYWTKLYQRILQSSVWRLPSDFRIVWITFLALKDKNGCVFGTAGWVADQAKVGDEVFEKALKVFLEPDRRSRTPDNDGRKLEVIEGGWLVLNHHLYRDGIEDQQEKWKRQKAAQRAKEAEVLVKLQGWKGTTEELVAKLKEIHGENGQEPFSAAAVERVVKKVVALEAAEDKVRKKYNPDFDPSKAAEKITLKDGEPAATFIKKSVDEDPLTKEDAAAVRAMGGEEDNSENFEP